MPRDSSSLSVEDLVFPIPALEVVSGWGGASLPMFRVEVAPAD